MAKMGLQFGLENGSYCKRQHHWMFIVDGVIGDEQAINALPPSKSARPSLSFKETSVHHLIEDVFLPGKPDWKPITITVFDLKKNENALWNWIKEIYDPNQGIFNVPNQNKSIDKGFIRQCQLVLYDGCGTIIEQWVFDDCWPQSIDFKTLDYSQNDVLTADLTLRYVRAYVREN